MSRGAAFILFLIALIVAGSAGAARAENVPPTIEFRTTPAADANNRISGRFPLTVSFNMCHIEDPDPGDDFRFRYDFEGSGQFVPGICRGSHVYHGSECVSATVCASDRQPEHEACHTYDICPAAGGGGTVGGPGMRLLFWVWNGASSGNAADALDASIDGNSVFTLITGDPAFTARYVLVNLDISAYADGAAHQLGFSSATTGPSNFSVDDVSVRCNGGGNRALDPGFEAGATGNPKWSETSSTFVSPVCSLASCGDGGGTARPHAGAWWAWFGGTSGAETASVVQGSITIPVCN